MRFLWLAVLLIFVSSSVYAAEKCRPMVQSSDLATLYEDGDVFPQDFTLAAKLYRQSAETGETFAQYKLGSFYYEGKGVKQDYEEAYFWTGLAAYKEEKYVDALNHVARKLTPEKTAAAEERVRGWLKEFYSRPCSIHIHGGTRTNYRKVGQEIRSRRNAANQGDAKAQQQMAWWYAVGGDHKDAYFWAKLAVSSGDEKCDCFSSATIQVQNAAKHLTPGEIGDLEERLKTWESTHTHITSAPRQ